METLATIYKFETKNFELKVTAEEELDFDQSYMEPDLAEEIFEKLGKGDLVLFCAKASLIDKQTGQELAVDYLGQCIHEVYETFRDNLGIKNKKRGSYFSDMIHTVLREGREFYNEQWERVVLNH
jgi:hypothetical protein